MLHSSSPVMFVEQSCLTVMAPILYVQADELTVPSSQNSSGQLTASKAKTASPQISGDGSCGQRLCHMIPSLHHRIPYPQCPRQAAAAEAATSAAVTAVATSASTTVCTCNRSCRCYNFSGTFKRSAATANAVLFTASFSNRALPTSNCMLWRQLSSRCMKSKLSDTLQQPSRKSTVCICHLPSMLLVHLSQQLPVILHSNIA